MRFEIIENRNGYPYRVRFENEVVNWGSIRFSILNSLAYAKEKKLKSKPYKITKTGLYVRGFLRGWALAKSF